MKKTIVKFGILFLVFCVCFNVFAFSFSQQKHKDKQAFDFTLKDLVDKSYSLSEFEGKGVILFFWTTWCRYCRAELTEFNKEYKSIQDSDIELLAINIGESKAKVDSFIRGYSVEYPILLDYKNDVASNYGVVGVPTIIFISKDRQIIEVAHALPPNYKDYFLQK